MIKKDYYTFNMRFGSLVKGIFTGHTFYAVLLYRQGNFLARHKIKFFPDCIKYFSLKHFSCEISPYAKIGGGFRVHHTPGVVIGHQVIMGENCEVFQNVTIGSSRIEKDGQIMPIIGNNVTIYSGSVVTGPIKIGNNVVIGANSVVTKDIPDNCFVAGAPAKIIRYFEDRNHENRPNL